MLQRILDNYRLTVALGIVLASIFSAVMAWRAAATGERAANTDEQARQQFSEREQIESNLSQQLNQDLREFGRYESLLLEAQRLEADAGRSGGAASAELADRASRLRSEAEVLEPFFLFVPTVRGEGRDVTYPLAASRRFLFEGNPELDQLRPEELREEARVARADSVRLTALAAMFIGSVFLLTLGEVVRPPRSRRFAVAGATLASVALILFVVL